MKSSYSLLLITLLAAALRFYGLGEESLWQDEGILLGRIEGSVMNLLTDRDSGNQGPLFAFMAKIWIIPFGTSEVSLRFLPAIFGILCVPAIYLLALRLFGTATALLSALFMAVNGYAIYHSQDFRPYSLFLLSTILSYYCLHKLFSELNQKNILLYLFATLCALYAHAYGPFFLLSQILIVLIYKPEPFKSYLKIFGTLMLGYLPMLAVFAHTFFRKIEDHQVAAGWLKQPPVLMLIGLPKAYFSNLYLSFGICALLILSAVLFRKKIPEYKKEILFLIAIIFSLAVIPWTMSNLMNPFYTPRFTLPALSAFIILAAWCLQFYIKPVRLTAIAFFLVFSTVALYDYYTKTDKEPWEKTAQIMTSLSDTHDKILINPAYFITCFNYYFPKEKNIAVKAFNNYAELDSLRENSERLWLVRTLPLGYKKTTDPLLIKFNTHYDSVRTYFLKDSVSLNPDAFHTVDIQITLYEPKTQP